MDEKGVIHPTFLRTEADRASITLLDRRMVTQRYGKAILNALPPLRREIE
nr:helicase C-terminal domain-containing protein [Pseudomonas mangrovi]